MSQRLFRHHRLCLQQPVASSNGFYWGLMAFFIPNIYLKITLAVDIWWMKSCTEFLTIWDVSLNTWIYILLNWKWDTVCFTYILLSVWQELLVCSSMVYKRKCTMYVSYIREGCSFDILHIIYWWGIVIFLMICAKSMLLIIIIYYSWCQWRIFLIFSPAIEQIYRV